MDINRSIPYLPTKKMGQDTSPLQHHRQEAPAPALAPRCGRWRPPWPIKMEGTQVMAILGYFEGQIMGTHGINHGKS